MTKCAHQGLRTETRRILPTKLNGMNCRSRKPEETSRTTSEPIQAQTKTQKLKPYGIPRHQTLSTRISDRDEANPTNEAEWLPREKPTTDRRNSEQQCRKKASKGRDRTGRGEAIYRSSRAANATRRGSMRRAQGGGAGE